MDLSLMIARSDEKFPSPEYLSNNADYRTFNLADACCENVHRAARYLPDKGRYILFVPYDALEEVGTRMEHYFAWLDVFSSLGVYYEDGVLKNFLELYQGCNGSFMGIKDSLTPDNPADFEYMQSDYVCDEFDNEDGGGYIDDVSHSWLGYPDSGGLIVSVPYKGGTPAASEISSSITQSIRMPHFISSVDYKSKGKYMAEWYDKLYMNESLRDWDKIVLSPLIWHDKDWDYSNDYIMPFITRKSFVPSSRRLFLFDARDGNVDEFGNNDHASGLHWLFGRGLDSYFIDSSIDYYKAYVEWDKEELEKIVDGAKKTVKYSVDRLTMDGRRVAQSIYTVERLIDSYIKEREEDLKLKR